MGLYLVSLLLLSGFVYSAAKALPTLSLEASSSNQMGTENPDTEHIMSKQHSLDDFSEQKEPQNDLKPLNEELPHTHRETQDNLTLNGTQENSDGKVQKFDKDANKELNDDEFLSVIKKDPYFAPPETLHKSPTNLWSGENIRGRVKRDWKTHWDKNKRKYGIAAAVGVLIGGGTLIAQNMQNAQNFGGGFGGGYGVPNYGGWWKRK